MNGSSLKNTFSLNEISSAPRRPQKLGSVQSIVPDEPTKSDPPLFDEIVLSDDEEKTSSTETVKCQICYKDMTHWMNARRDIHTKVCKMKQAEKEKERKTIRKSKKLTETIEKNDKVLEKHSLEPREPQKSWELSKNNVKFARIAADDEENRKRKRPRSFAVVELAPKKCQCEVLTTLHTRFINEFHSKSVKTKNENEGGVTEHAFQMKKIIEKLSRYEQLSSDMQKTLDDTSGNITPTISLRSSDGFTIECHSLILKHRTSMMKTHPRSEIIEVTHTKDVLKAWVTFVFTANIEWGDDEKDGIKDLANKYGPIGLESLIKEKEKSEETQEKQDNALFDSGLTSIYQTDVISEALLEVNAEESIVGQMTEEDRSPVDFYASDNPFVEFGRTPEKEDGVDDGEIVVDDFPSTTSFSAFPKLRDNVTMDSFDEWSNQPTNIPSTSSVTATVTPVKNIPKPMFGSHVKILKTNDITPMPLFDNMDEAELKERMKEIGMRPKGKKTMIQILKKAYTTLHPEVCIGTPTIRPLIKYDEPEKGSVRDGKGVKKTAIVRTKTLSERISGSPKKVSPKKTISKHSSFLALSEDSGEVDVDSDADKTLNLSNDDREVGKICGDDIGDDDEDEDGMVASSSTGKSNDLNSLKVAFLTWLRNAHNSVLYEHILSLQPVSLEEMLVRLEKAEGQLGRMGKGKLVKLLDMLRITYQLPQKPGRMRAGGFKRKL